MPISIENNKIIISSPSTLEKVGEVKISSIKDVEKNLILHPIIKNGPHLHYLEDVAL